jgi:hypothetical protein
MYTSRTPAALSARFSCRNGDQRLALRLQCTPFASRGAA